MFQFFSNNLIASGIDFSIASNSLFVSILNAWKILDFSFGQPAIISASSRVVSNFLCFLKLTILCEILFAWELSQYFIKISQVH